MLRPLCARWAYGSGTHAHAERARQELMRALSIRVRNWCVHWAYASGTNACTERSPFKTCWAYTHKELMRTLSIRVRFSGVKIMKIRAISRKSHTWAPVTCTWIQNPRAILALWMKNNFIYFSFFYQAGKTANSTATRTWEIDWTRWKTRTWVHGYFYTRVRICKRLRSPESIPRNRFRQPM